MLNAGRSLVGRRCFRAGGAPPNSPAPERRRLRHGPPPPARKHRRPTSSGTAGGDDRADGGVEEGWRGHGFGHGERRQGREVARCRFVGRSTSGGAATVSPGSALASEGDERASLRRASASKGDV